MPNLTSPDFCTPWETYASRRDGGRWNIEKLVLWNPYVHIYTDQIPVYPCLTLSFSRMTYRRDYLDVDLSLRFEPITHQEYIYRNTIYIQIYIQNIYTYIYTRTRIPPFLHRSLLRVSASASIIVALAIFHRDSRDKKKYSPARLKSHPVIWERASFSSVHFPFTTRFPRTRIKLHHAPINLDTGNSSIWYCFFVRGGGGNQSSGFLIWEFLGVKGRERCLSLESFEFTQEELGCKI